MTGEGSRDRRVRPADAADREIADHPDYSIAATGELTVVALMRPDSLEMPAQERTGYVHWLGKGVPGQDEWTFRMYQRGNTEDRENRISCYAFNLDARAGGTRLGIGSHFQDELTPGQWLLVAGAWDATRVHIYWMFRRARYSSHRVYPGCIVRA